MDRKPAMDERILKLADVINSAAPGANNINHYYNQSKPYLAVHIHITQSLLDVLCWLDPRGLSIKTITNS